MTATANDVLMGTSVPTLKMGKKHVPQGTMRGGRIVGEPQSYQVRDFKTQELKFYPKSGDPIMGLWVDVQTDERDPSIDGDTGARRMYVEKKRQLDAVRDAVRAVGAPGLAAGGELWMAWTGEEQVPNAVDPALTWEAQYKPPAVPVPGTAPTTATAPPVPTQQPAPIATATTTPAAPNALAGLTPEQLQALAALAPQPAAQAAPPF